MASVRMVGQHPAPHRLDSEPQLLLLKLSSAGKKLPLPRKASWERIGFRRTNGEDTGAQPVSSGPVGGTAAGGGLVPAAGCPCQGTDDSGEGTARSSDPNPGCPGAHSACSRRRDSTRTPCNRAGGTGSPHGCCAPPSAGGRSGSLPLERLTQGPTGVVRLARTEPHRREAWSIFPQRNDPERGEGHCFQTRSVTQDWCDACSRLITAQTLKCRNCSYTCHLECERRVKLDCNLKDTEPGPTAGDQSSSPAPPHKSETKEEEEGEATDLPEEEVQTKIEEYNSQVSENGMKLATDGSYTGFIKVHLRLSRPVTVPAVEEENSDAASDQTDCNSRVDDSELPESGLSEKRTSFYLPCDCVKQLHISSMTTTGEVIQGLLKKFMVLDNPRKFALYRQTHRDGQDLFQKLPLCERPLLLRLIAGPDAEKLSFVLKENETGEVEWHAFSVPELQNFLVILEKEEAERVRAVEQKYAVYRQKLLQALQQQDTSAVIL